MKSIALAEKPRWRPPEGWHDIEIVSSKREVGQYGPQIAISYFWRDALAKEKSDAAPQWLPAGGEAGYGLADPVAKCFAAVHGKAQLELGEEMDDEDLIGIVSAHVEHYTSGKKSKTPGVPKWRFNDFQPSTKNVNIPISADESAQIRAAFVAVYGEEEEVLKVKSKELITKALGGAFKKTSELTRAEAEKVKARLSGVADALGKEIDLAF